MYNVNPFDLIISEPFLQLDGENFHKLIGFEIETGEELVLFRGTWGECQNFINSIEATAMAQLRHYHKLMDEFVTLERQMVVLEEELREQEYAYDRLLADYDDLDRKYQYEVAKNEVGFDKPSNLLLRRIANGKTNRGDAIRLLHRSFGMSCDEARRCVDEAEAKA